MDIGNGNVCDVIILKAKSAEVAAWNDYAGGDETIKSYNEDLNSGASGLHPTSVRAFNAGWVAGTKTGYWRGRD
jgi:hypothetical protein